MKKAFITGVTGQDGSYLADLLLSKGYEVHGLIRRSSSFNRWRIVDAEKNRLKLHYGDLSDSLSLVRSLNEIQPDEVYNLAAQSHVKVSFSQPEYTADVDATGAIRLLEAVRMTCPQARFYQASSSEMYGTLTGAADESTPFNPQSPYACSKVFAYYATKHYRQAYGMHASNGILFNHESPRRGENFVTRKITRAVVRIAAGEQDFLALGNINAKRDWGYAPDYVEAMWLMLQQPQADDYVIATGFTYSVKEFCIDAFSAVNLDWTRYVRHDPQFDRPSDVEYLLGNPAKAERQLGWRPKTHCRELVKIMVEADRKELLSLPHPDKVIA